MKKKSLLITAIAVFGFAIISMAQTVPSYVPTSGLVGWWPFTGNAIDSSGNGNNGTVYGATLTADRFGNVNAAYNFDGMSNFIEVSSSPSLCVSSAYSISAWAYISAYNSGGFPYQPAIVSKIVGGDWYGGYEVRALSDVTGIPKIIGTSGNIGGSNVALNASGNNINQWYNIIITYDGSIMKCYVDGVCKDSGFFSGSLQTSATPLRFGRRGGGPGFDCWLTGFVDDIGIWNRALDSCEIKDIYFARPASCCHISVSTQPVSQSATISNTAQFTIASSDSSSTYQWQSDLGIGFQNINSVGQYSGTTNDTLSVSSVTMSNNNQPFRCIIRSGSCYDTSDIAILSVCGAVTTPPANQNVVINNTAQFTTASSDLLATYQWQSDLGVGFRNLNSVGQYSGTSKDTLRVANVTMGNNNQPFRCIVSSGACSDTSSAAVLTVMNANGINETATNNLFTVYPNPAKSQINVKVDATMIGSSYAIYDNIGKVTLSGKINAENTVIELGSLSGGIYLFSIGDNLKQMFTVVKE